MKKEKFGGPDSKVSTLRNVSLFMTERKHVVKCCPEAGQKNQTTVFFWPKVKFIYRKFGRLKKPKKT